MVRPNPRHSGQAPSGLLKLKSPGVGGRISRSQWAQCQPVEKGISDVGLRIAERESPLSGFRFPVSEIGMMLILSFPKRRAVSRASIKRGRFDSEIVIRS